MFESLDFTQTKPEFFFSLKTFWLYRWNYVIFRHSLTIPKRPKVRVINSIYLSVYKFLTWSLRMPKGPMDRIQSILEFDE